jgi:hypothetical protein
MAWISDTGRFAATAVLLLAFALGGRARAADMCTGPGQVLVPDANGHAMCVAGYDGSNVGNCAAVPHAVSVETATGMLTCMPGPSCPTGYAKGLPPVVGAPKGAESGVGGCTAICSKAFTSHAWPCSCPYGQHLDASGNCSATCGPSATWQHTPGFVWQESVSIDSNPPETQLKADPGVCTCPSGDEYVASTRACMALCLPGQQRDGNGTCFTPYVGNPGAPEVCKSGQSVKTCQCPSGGRIRNGLCIICAVDGPTGPGTPGQDPACAAPDGATSEGDGYVPGMPGQSAACAPGTRWNGVHCVIPQPASPVCAQGSHWSGNTCVPDATDGDGYQPGHPMQPGTCAAGMHWNGLHCIANPPATPVCAMGSRWDGRTCVRITLVPACAAGTHWDGSRCARGPMPVQTCPRDTHWDGRTCAADGCSTREHWDGRRCVGNQDGP